MGRKSGTQGSSVGSLSVSLGKLLSSLQLSCAISTEKMFLSDDILSLSSFCFKRFDEVVDIQIEEILS